MIDPKNFLGMNDFQWGFACVENIDDPKEIGRVQARWFGIHTLNKNDIPTSALPWCMVMMPTDSASMGAVGRSPHGLMKGSLVFGGFLDGRRCQHPMIIGTIHGVHATSFFEEDYSYPMDGNDEIGGINKQMPNYELSNSFRASDTDDSIHPIAKSPGLNTSKPDKVNFIKNNIEFGIMKEFPVSANAIFMGEPAVSDINGYNDAQVTSYKDGSFESWGTNRSYPNWQKFHFKQNNYEEIDCSGNHKIRTTGDRTQLVGQNSYLAARYDNNIVAAEGNLREYCGNEFEHYSRGSYKNVLGDDTTHVNGCYTLKVSGTLIIDANAIKIVTSDGPIDIRSAHEFNVEASDMMNIQSGSDIVIESFNNYEVWAHGSIVTNSDDAINSCAGGACDIQSTAGMKIASGQQIDVHGGTQLNMAGDEFNASSGTGDVNIQSASAININGSNDLRMKGSNISGMSEGVFNMQGNDINIKSKDTINQESSAITLTASASGPQTGTEEESE